MSAAGLRSEYIQGWRLWSDLHYPADFEPCIVRELLDELHEENHPLSGMNLLEIGCGDGRVMRRFAHLCRSVVGVDTNEAMIEVLQAELAEAFAAFVSSDQCQGSFNTSVEKMSGLDLQFEDGTFDLVLYPWSLHQIPDKEKALSEAKRVLVDEGRLIVFGLLPGGEYENTVAALGLDPGPQVDPVSAYEEPLMKVFGNIRGTRVIGRGFDDKQFGFKFHTHEEARQAWLWALKHWHDRDLTQQDLHILEQCLLDNTHENFLFMNIHGKAYLSTK